jgi:alcohol dehydrogenase class IV
VEATHFRFDSPAVRILAGSGALDELPGEVAERGDDVVLVVAHALLGHELARRVAELLRVEVENIVSVAARPAADAIRTVAQSHARATVAVALGGGSTMDAAKSIASYVGARRTVVIPSTFAASAVTGAAALYEGNELVRLSAPSLAPSLVVLDPRVAFTAPPELMVASGLVAVAHAIEPLFVKTRDPISSCLALAALKRIGAALPDIVESGQDADVMGSLQVGAIMAGLAIRSARGGLQHAMAHALTLRCHVPHAFAHAALLPHTLRFRVGPIATELELAQTALGVVDVATWCASVAAGAGLPAHLALLGVSTGRLTSLAQAISTDRGRLDLDPRGAVPADLEELLRAAM